MILNVTSESILSLGIMKNSEAALASPVPSTSRFSFTFRKMLSSLHEMRNGPAV